MSSASLVAALWSLSACGMYSSILFRSSAARFPPPSLPSSTSAAFFTSTCVSLSASSASAVWRFVVGDIRERIILFGSEPFSIFSMLSMIAANPEMKKYPTAIDALLVSGRISLRTSRRITLSLSMTASLPDLCN